MQFIPVPNTMKCDFIYHVGTTFCSNTLYVKQPTPPNENDIATVANACADWYLNHMRLIQPAEVNCDRIEVRDLTTADGLFHSIVPGSTGGQKLGSILPMNCTLAVKFSSDRAGRSYRGRNYFIGLTEADVTGDFVSQGMRDSLVQVYDTFNSDFWALERNWVIVSRYNNLQPRAAGVTSFVTGISVESTVDSQRRRLSGRGR